MAVAPNEVDSDELLALAEGEEFESEFSELLQSLHRVRNEEERQQQDTVQEFLREARKTADARAADIYLQKELAAACQTSRERLKSADELDLSIEALQQCSINAAAVQFAVQQSVINGQLQENLHQQLQSAEQDLSPSLKSTVAASQSALAMAARVAERIAAVEEKKRLLRERRVELAQLHQRVTDLWMMKEERDLSKNKRSDTGLTKKKREKLQHKEDQLDLLIHFIQSIMTGLSKQWGSDSRLVNVLKACELYKSGGQSVDWTQLCKLLDANKAD